MRQLEGAKPEVVHRELAAVCTTFNQDAKNLGTTAGRGVLDYTRARANGDVEPGDSTQ